MAVVEAGAAVQGEQNRIAAPHHAHLTIVDGFRGQILLESAGVGSRRRGEEGTERLADPLCRGVPGQSRQGAIYLLDAAFGVAHDHHVGHGRLHAGDEGLHFLQFSVLALKLHLVTYQVFVGLVHLVDHVYPDEFRSVEKGVAVFRLFHGRCGHSGDKI